MMTANAFRALSQAAGRTDSLTLNLAGLLLSGIRADGKPSYILTLLPNHPIALGIPRRFTIPQTESMTAVSCAAAGRRDF